MVHVSGQNLPCQTIMPPFVAARGLSMKEVREFRASFTARWSKEKSGNAHSGKNPLFRYSGLVHMVDLLPTVLSLAGVEHLIPRLQLDGVTHWEAINSLKPLAGPRTGFIYNIDDK